MKGLKGQELYLSKKVGQAIMDYQMLSDGDRIAVGVSGGKDSLCLLRMLKIRQEFCPIKYRLIAVHIDLGHSRKDSARLKAYLKKTGYEYIIKKLELPPGKSHRLKKQQNKSCFWCAWNRRKMIFQTAAETGCNKVALGHNMDDIVQTMLLNLFFNSEISAMSPKQELFKGKLTIIRPLAYVPENRIARFVQVKGMPLAKNTCSNSFTSNRKKIAQLIKDLEKTCPHIKTNIFRSIRRIKQDYLL